MPSPDTPLLRQIGFARNRTLWIISAAGSALLMLFIIAGADLQALERAVEGSAPGWLLIALVFLILEGVCSSLRLALFGRRRAHGLLLKPAFEANALYVLGIAFLPARLGEVVGVYVMHRFIRLRGGEAVMAILAQRLFDLLVLGGAVLPFVLLMAFLERRSDVFSPTSLMVLAGSGCAVLALTGVLLWRPDRALTPLARLSAARRMGTAGLVRALVRLVLQARLWCRHHYAAVGRIGVGGITLVKWIANILGLSAILTAVGLALPVEGVIAIVVLYNFLLAVPIPTVGGVGVSEAGLSALLVLAGVPLPDALAASLLVRAVLVIFPLVYAGGTWGVTALVGRRRREAGG